MDLSNLTDDYTGFPSLRIAKSRLVAKLPGCLERHRPASERPRKEEHVTPTRLMLLVCSWALWSSAMVGSEPPVRFRIDPAASLVWFDADARLHSFRGQTHKINGYFTLQSSAPPQIAEAKVIIEAASLETGNTERDADMRNDFLEVRRFPSIEFGVTELVSPRSIAGGTEWDLVL